MENDIYDQKIPRIRAHKTLARTLEKASEVFQEKGDSGREGLRVAAGAVVLYIAQRDKSMLLAAPFIRLIEALNDLENGRRPELFDLSSADRKHSRSTPRQKIKSWAAACLEVLSDGGKSLAVAAPGVARRVRKWPGIGQQEIKAKTAIAWRDDIRAGMKSEPATDDFNDYVKYINEASDPKAAAAAILKSGPPGIAATRPKTASRSET